MVHQMLAAFILFCMILIISSFHLCLVLVRKTWWRQINDRYLFLILNFRHGLLNMKMTPKKSLSAMKSDLTSGMLFFVKSAKIAYSYPCIIQRVLRYG